MSFNVEGVDVMPPRKAGKRGARESHEPRLMLSQFRTSLPTPPSEWDGTHGITQWGMDGNDQWGDCGAAATDHGDVAKTGDTSEIGQLGKPKYNGTLATYWAYGLSQGETGQPPNQSDQPDQGVDNASWLAFLYKEGIINGYGEVPLDHLHAYAVELNGLLMGVQLDDDAEQDFEAVPPVPWGSLATDTPDPNMGHDILFIKYSADGTAAVVTWGGLQAVTAEFLRDNVTDAWAILDEDDAHRAGINWSDLQAALQAVHGTEGPNPSPAVSPVPAPAGARAVFQEIEEFAHDVEERVGTWWRSFRDISVAPGTQPPKSGGQTIS